jgi:uncharacterized membrane protein
VSCVNRVAVKTTDLIPPETKISVVQKGKVHTVSSKDLNGKVVEVLEGTELFFVVSGKDSLGIKSLTAEVLQNGTFNIRDQLYTTFTEDARAVDTSGTGIDQIFFGGTLIPDSPLNESLIRSKAKDHANNESLSPTLRISYTKHAVARLSANVASIQRGESANLVWETEQANSVILDGNVATTFNGNLTVSPTQTKSYILEAINNVSVDRDTVTIRVIQPASAPIITSFSANPTTITRRQSTTLSWNTQNANNINISPGNLTPGNSNNSLSVSPTTTTTYTLTASGNGGSITKTTRVTVNPPASQTLCLSTPYQGIEFNYDGPVGPFKIYSLNIPSIDLPLYNNKRLTSVKNKNSFMIKLFYGNQISVDLNPNQSTTLFNGKSIFAEEWSFYCGSTIFSPNIEFCYEN